MPSHFKDSEKFKSCPISLVRKVKVNQISNEFQNTLRIYTELFKTATNVFIKAGEKKHNFEENHETHYKLLTTYLKHT